MLPHVWPYIVRARGHLFLSKSPPRPCVSIRWLFAQQNESCEACSCTQWFTFSIHDMFLPSRDVLGSMCRRCSQTFFKKVWFIHQRLASTSISFALSLLVWSSDASISSNSSMSPPRIKNNQHSWQDFWTKFMRSRCFVEKTRWIVPNGSIGPSQGIPNSVHVVISGRDQLWPIWLWPIWIWPIHFLIWCVSWWATAPTRWRRGCKNKMWRKNCGKIKIYSDEFVFNCSNKFFIRKKFNCFHKSWEKLLNKMRIDSESDAASSSQVRLQDAYVGWLMDKATEKSVAVDFSESGDPATGKPCASSDSDCQESPKAVNVVTTKTTTTKWAMRPSVIPTTASQRGMTWTRTKTCSSQSTTSTPMTTVASPLHRRLRGAHDTLSSHMARTLVHLMIASDTSLAQDDRTWTLTTLHLASCPPMNPEDKPTDPEGVSVSQSVVVCCVRWIRETWSRKKCRSVDWFLCHEKHVQCSLQVFWKHPEWESCWQIRETRGRKKLQSTD